MIKLAALIPLFPLIGFILNGLFGKKMGKGLSGSIACVAMFLSFGVALAVFLELQTAADKATVINLFSWINSGTLQIPFEFLIDPLSSVFLLIITGIGSINTITLKIFLLTDGINALLSGSIPINIKASFIGNYFHFWSCGRFR